MVNEYKSSQHYSLKGDKFKYLPVDRQDIVRGRCKCNRCDKFANVFYYKFLPHERLHYSVCVECVLELDPPKLELMLATTNQLCNNIIPTTPYDLWDNTNSRQERAMSIEEFVECGWFIRKLKEERRKVPKRTILTINLEYHGNLICDRCKDHYDRLGLDDMNRCNSPFCKFMFTTIYNK